MLEAIEIKSGTTLTSDYFKGLDRFRERLAGAAAGPTIHPHVVYGGAESQRRSNAHVRTWRDISKLISA